MHCSEWKHMKNKTQHLISRSIWIQVIVVQSLSRAQHFATPWTAAHQCSQSFTIAWSLFKLRSIKLVMPSTHLVFFCTLIHLPSIFPSIRVFFNGLALHIRWPKCWSFSFIISPSKENSGLTSFRIDWFDLLAVQGTVNNFLQNHSSKASVLQYSAFFMIQPSHWYMTTGKTIGLITWTLSVKWCLCFLIFCLGFL